MKRKVDLGPVGLHPGRHIVVSKKELQEQLWFRNEPNVYLRFFACKPDDPRYEEWLTKSAYRLQLLGSFVYLVRCTVYPGRLTGASGAPFYTKKIAKPPAKYYKETVFDPCCESLDECKDHLIGSFKNDNISESEVTDELVRKVFEKYLALQKYALPMLANVEEYGYFSFFRQVLLYISRHNTYPDFPIDSSFKCPTIPEIYDFEIDMDY